MMQGHCATLNLCYTELITWMKNNSTNVLLLFTLLTMTL